MPIRLVLTGPTAVGKTSLSIALAKALHAEIICLDSRQVFKGFCIGTAQPSVKECTLVKHHLTNFLSPSETFSSGAFVRLVNSLLNDFKDKNFLLVGGTGLYLKALIEGLPDMPLPDTAMRARVKALANSMSPTAFYEYALRVDYNATVKLKINDVQRVSRVIEVFEQTGKPLSEWQKERSGGIGPLPTVFLNRSRDELYARIDARVEQMVKDGFLDEVKELSETVPKGAFAWNTLGYPEMLQVLQGEISIQEAIEKIQQNTRHFAKRQLTWFRHQVDALEISLSQVNETEAIAKCLSVAN